MNGSGRNERGGDAGATAAAAAATAAAESSGTPTSFTGGFKFEQRNKSTCHTYERRVSDLDWK